MNLGKNLDFDFHTIIAYNTEIAVTKITLWAGDYATLNCSDGTKSKDAREENWSNAANLTHSLPQLADIGWTFSPVLEEHSQIYQCSLNGPISYLFVLEVMTGILNLNLRDVNSSNMKNYCSPKILDTW